MSVQNKHPKAQLAYFEDMDLMENRYAVVVMWSIIEHFINPLIALKKAWRILQPRGYLILEGSNFDSFSRKALRENWSGFTSGHFYFFGIKSLRKILGIAGFTDIIFYHPSNKRFFATNKLMWRILLRIIFFIFAGPLINRSSSFFVIAKKPA